MQDEMSIETKFKKAIPGFIQDQILFLDHWDEPPGFITLPTRERLKLMAKYAKLHTAPTKQNFWIWFGAFAKPRYQPTYGQTVLPRFLYEAMNGPLVTDAGKPRRLVNSFVTTPADVNIFKFVPACGSRLKNQQYYVHEVKHNVDHEVLMQKRDQINAEIVKEMVKRLLEFKNDFTTIEQQTWCLEQLGFARSLIPSAIAEYNKLPTERVPNDPQLSSDITSDD